MKIRILESSADSNKMIISPISGINSDGFIIEIKDIDGKGIYKQEYRYGYNAAYDRSFADEKSIYVADIINDLCSRYSIDKSTIDVVAGDNKFTGKKVSNTFVDNFKKYLNEDASIEWKPNTSFKHIKDIYNKVKANDYKFVNNEREEFTAAVKKAENKGYKPEECRQIKDWNRDIWQHNRKTESVENTKSQFKVGDIFDFSGLYGQSFTLEVKSIEDNEMFAEVSWTAEDSGEIIRDNHVYELVTDDSGNESVVVWEYHGHKGYVYPKSNTNESVLQDIQKAHQDVKTEYGEEVYNALNDYIKLGNDLGDILYRESEWNKFVDWAKENGITIKNNNQIDEDVPMEYADSDSLKALRDEQEEIDADRKRRKHNLELMHKLFDRYGFRHSEEFWADKVWQLFYHAEEITVVDDASKVPNRTNDDQKVKYLMTIPDSDVDIHVDAYNDCVWVVTKDDVDKSLSENVINEDQYGRYSDTFKKIVRKYTDSALIVGLVDDIVRYAKEADLRDLYYERGYDSLDLNESISEDNELKSEVSNFVEDRILSALDNLSMVVASEIANYNSDWCDTDGQSAASNRLSQNISTLVKSIVDVLFSQNSGLNEAITYDNPERMGQAHCAPTVPVIDSYIEDVLNEIKKGNKADYLKDSLKNWKALLDDSRQEVENFNDYWKKRYEASIKSLDSQVALIPSEYIGEAISEDIDAEVSDEANIFEIDWENVADLNWTIEYIDADKLYHLFVTDSSSCEIIINGQEFTSLNDVVEKLKDLYLNSGSKTEEFVTENVDRLDLDRISNHVLGHVNETYFEKFKLVSISEEDDVLKITINGETIGDVSTEIGLNNISTLSEADNLALSIAADLIRKIATLHIKTL